MQHRKNPVLRLVDGARRNWRLVATGTVATGAILTLAASTATAAGMVDRSDLTDALRGDINNVWKSELAPNSKGDINSVYSSEIVNGGVHENDLSQGVQDQLGATGPNLPASLSDTAQVGDNGKALTLDPQTFASIKIPAGASYAVTATAQLQNIENDEGDVDLDHGACRLIGPGGTIDSGSLALGQDTGTGEVAFGQVTLTAVVSNDTPDPQTFNLKCFGGGEMETSDTRTINAASITGVQVAGD